MKRVLDSKTLINLSLVLGSILFGVGLIEVFGNLLLGAKKDELKLLYFYTQNSLVTDDDGARRFSPNTAVRTVAVVANRVEYDTSFKTNNLGMIQKMNITPSQKVPGVAFLGDSFTQGVGAYPWFYRMEEQFNRKFGQNKINLFNLGIVGAGVLNFQKNLDALKKEGFKVSKVVIVLISDDLTREYNRTKPGKDGIHSCNAKECSSVPVYWSISGGESPEALIKRAKELRQQGSIFENSFIKYLIDKILIISRKNDSTDIINQSLGAIRKISDQYGSQNVAIIHLPMKGEVSRNQYSAYTATFFEEMSKLKLFYFDGLKQCRLQTQDFHKLDAHPNQDGYDKIAQCITPRIEAFLGKESSALNSP
jgi:lysophospholipase L1-like esterase